MSRLGVPTPYKAHVHPYPTRYHGPNYSRPVFGMPTIARTQDVIISSQMQNGTSGLGSVDWDTRRGVFGPPIRGSGIFSGAISGLGEELTFRELSYPWGQYSEDTKELQTQTNIALKAAGYCPVTVDGKLGPATCGARNWLTVESPNAIFSNPPTCQGYKNPTKASAGCGGGAAAPGPALPGAPTMTASSMTGSGQRALAFTVGGLAVVGAIYYLKKKRR